MSGPGLDLEALRAGLRTTTRCFLLSIALAIATAPVWAPLSLLWEDGAAVIGMAVNGAACAIAYRNRRVQRWLGVR